MEALVLHGPRMEIRHMDPMVLHGLHMEISRMDQIVEVARGRHVRLTDTKHTVTKTF